MPSEPHVQIRKRFDKFIDETKKDAIKQAALSVDISALDQLTPEQQVKFLNQQFRLLNDDIASFETVEYYCFAGNEMLVYKIFYSRILCSEKNEEQNIRDGFVFFEKHNLLHKLLLKAKKQVAPYTYKNFLDNKYNEMLYASDEQPYNITDQDYFLILEWQTNKKADGAYCGFDLLKDNFLRAVDKKKNCKQLIEGELANLENISKNVIGWVPEKLTEALVRIKGLKDLMMPERMDEFHLQLCSVIKGDKMNRLLSPAFLADAMKQISDRRICSPVVFYLSMLMYSRWLNDVLIGKADMYEQGYIRYDDLYYLTLNEGQALGTLTNERFKKKFNLLSKNEEQYKEALTQEYHKQYRIFSNLIYPHYFDLLENDKKLKNAFINDCLYSINSELPIEELRRTIVLNEMIEFLDEEMSLAFHNPLAPLCYVPFEKMHLVEVLCHLTPETAQIKQLMEILTRVTDHCHHDRVPVCFINDELNYLFTNLFKQTVIIYKKHIEGMTTDKRGLFVSEQQRDIKYMLRLYKIDHKEPSPFYKHVKHILKDESISTQQMYPYRMVETNDDHEIIKTKAIKPLSFGYRPGPRPLRPIVEAMNLEFDLFGDGTTVDDFMEVLMCKDLSKNTKIIHLAAKYNLIEGFRKRLMPWCSNLKPAVIEQSGIFMSLNEGPLKAMSLYKATPLLLEVEDRMDAIFKAKYR